MPKWFTKQSLTAVSKAVVLTFAWLSAVGTILVVEGLVVLLGWKMFLMVIGSAQPINFTDCVLSALIFDGLVFLSDGVWFLMRRAAMDWR